MTTTLVTGPGGAGSSTVSAALAVRAALAGRRAVLLSRRPVPVGDVEGLRVVTPDPQRAFEGLWGSVGPALTAALPDLPVPPASSVVAPPGAADLALLAGLADAQADGGADLVVVDAGPLEAALALLALPAGLRWWFGQVLPTRLRMLGAVRTAAVRTGAVRPGPVDAALAAVPAVERLLARVDLADPATTELRLVTEPREAAVAAVRDALPVLALHGQRPAVVHARVLADGGSGPWWDARVAEQDRCLADLAGLAPVAPLPELARAPAGADALAALLAADAVAPVASPEVPAPARVPGGWRLAVPLPFARRGALELTRWDDDLVVTVAGARRSLRLDPLLRRCVVTGGSLTDAGTATARLEVDFAPDPQQWPADLLAAEGSTA
ncbi:ion transporter [Blastococcus sp. SYSU D00813]